MRCARCRRMRHKWPFKCPPALFSSVLFAPPSPLPSLCSDLCVGPDWTHNHVRDLSQCGLQSSGHLPQAALLTLYGQHRRAKPLTLTMRIPHPQASQPEPGRPPVPMTAAHKCIHVPSRRPNSSIADIGTLCAGHAIRHRHCNTASAMDRRHEQPTDSKQPATCHTRKGSTHTRLHHVPRPVAPGRPRSQSFTRLLGSMLPLPFTEMGRSSSRYIASPYASTHDVIFVSPNARSSLARKLSILDGVQVRIT